MLNNRPGTPLAVDNNKSWQDITNLNNESAGSIEGIDSRLGVERVGISAWAEADSKAKVKDKSNKALLDT